MTSVTLDWPHKSLSPNARKDRRAIAPIRAKYRSDCAILAKQAGLRFPHLTEAHVRITFHPPCARKRDLDNLLASIKSGLDGVSDAMGVDDSRWEITIRKGEIRRPLGAVVVEVGATTEGRFVPLKGAV